MVKLVVSVGECLWGRLFGFGVAYGLVGVVLAVCGVVC